MQAAKTKLIFSPQDQADTGCDSKCAVRPQDKRASLSEDDDVGELAEIWGADAAEQLLALDFDSSRFDLKALEAHYAAGVGALPVLKLAQSRSK